MKGLMPVLSVPARGDAASTTEYHKDKDRLAAKKFYRKTIEYAAMGAAFSFAVYLKCPPYPSARGFENHPPCDIMAGTAKEENI
ncbi:hypothetical protein [Selenomonas sp. F0473]|uniref:hypothetical protein n=1 Tax=Selenomonas sp. F0473 TaxID=999423 RepID=UPI00030D2A15|nr:hypothetical protein [Selenomonas sp. F0473]